MSILSLYASSICYKSHRLLFDSLKQNARGRFNFFVSRFSYPEGMRKNLRKRTEASAWNPLPRMEKNNRCRSYMQESRETAFRYAPQELENLFDH